MDDIYTSHHSDVHYITHILGGDTSYHMTDHLYDEICHVICYMLVQTAFDDRYIWRERPTFLYLCPVKKYQATTNSRKQFPNGDPGRYIFLFTDLYPYTDMNNWPAHTVN